MKKLLFSTLKDLGFKKQTIELNNNNYIVFNKDKELFVFPKGRLYIHHYIGTRKQLDMNGWMTEKDFNKKFQQVLIKWQTTK